MAGAIMDSTLQAELDSSIANHSRWQGKDFNKAQAMLWIGITASLAAGVIAAFGAPKFITAVVSLIPGVILVVDRTFKHSVRSAWHAEYAIRLRALARAIRDQGAKPDQLSQQLTELEDEMQKKFPTLDSVSLRLGA